MQASLSRAPREPGPDLLRALAVVAVMLYHITSHGFDVPLLRAVGRHGWMGVDLFFVLSGYLIGWQVLRRTAAGLAPDWSAFLLRRALRLLPAYLAVLAVYLAVPVAREAEQMMPAWRFLTFAVNLFPDYQHYRAFSHAWSLCVEQHFYLLFPVAVTLLSRRPSMGKTVALAAGVFAGGMLLRGWLWHNAVAPQADASAVTLRYVELIYDPTWTRLDGLLLGVLLAALRAFRPAAWERALHRGWALLVLGLLLLAGAMRLDVLSLSGAVLQFPLVASGCACLLLAVHSPATRLDRIAIPGSRLLATLAYSLYLTHRQVYAWLDRVLPDNDAMPLPLAFCLYNGAALAVAAVLHLTVERPGLRLRAGLPAVDSADATRRQA